jgi:hypothetical protein
VRIAILHAGGSFARDYFAQFVSPNGHHYGKHEFVENPSEGVFDGLVVPQSMTPLDRRFDLVCPPTRTLCALLEPPDILTLPDEYTRQFHTVVGPDKRVACTEPRLTSAGHHWFVELTAKQAVESPITDKPLLVSAMISSKQHTEGHRIRYALMKRLKDHFGSRLDWFGRGVRDTGTNKLCALADYKYHIVLENGCWPHYWTEKLSDAFMANAFPFYWGAPNISEYFSPRAFCSIDPADAGGTINRIEEAIAADLWQERQSDLARARLQVVTDYHPYSLWASELMRTPVSAPRAISIGPFSECRFSLKQQARFQFRNAYRRMSGAQ